MEEEKDGKVNDAMDLYTDFVCRKSPTKDGYVGRTRGQAREEEEKKTRKGWKRFSLEEGRRR